jgi:two-component system LytT family sensor kinase
MKKIVLNWRIIFIVVLIGFMLFLVIRMYPAGLGLANNGKIDLLGNNFKQNKLVTLDGQWEFYWNKLLTPEDFLIEHKPQIDSFMKVPGAWDDGKAGTRSYEHNGVATYRLHLKYPSTLTDPAIRIQSVATAYKLYANGRLIVEVGKVSHNLSEFKDGEDSLILDMPKDTEELDLIFQVANLHYAKGGLRKSPVFGSKKVLEEQKLTLLVLQLSFSAIVFIFGMYYLFLFILQIKNKTALIFSILCFITALRSLIWGEAPLIIFFHNVTFKVLVYINYITGYNLIPIMILFVISIYPMEYKRTISRLVLIPTLFFDMLLLTPPGFMTLFTKYLYILMLLQMIYIMAIMIKVVVNKRDNAILMFIAIYIFILTIIQDILHYKGIGGINVSYMFLYGNSAVIMAMSFVQAKLQIGINKKLVLYNEILIEDYKLKDKIMATEMSFLQAQIKPHFLYNALDAIANICEEDGEKASELIVDLSIYLRGSLEFNNLDKMVRMEKEFEFVDTYFNIEQARFGLKIQLIKEIEISLDYPIPVLIIQPLVENAVRHGISKKQGGGIVTVRGMQILEGIAIEIEDDGVGIEGEKLALLLSEERNDQGVGLLNIHHRLLRLYGRGLDIRSEVGHGTCVRLVIPGGK